MHQIVYLSEAAAGLGQGDVFRIVEQSARNNPNADITGFLLLRGGRFLQLVEGPLMSLDALLTRLAQDPRHHSLDVVSRLPLAQRSFPRWRMKRLSDHTDGAALAEIETELANEGQGRPLPQVVRNFLCDQVAVRSAA